MVIPTGGIPWLTIVLILPLLGVAAVLLAHESLSRPVALVVSVLTLLVSLPLWFGFNNATAGMQFVEKHLWIDSPAIHYALGVDGISMPLVLLTTFLTPLCILVSWTSIQSRMKEFLISLLVMERDSWASISRGSSPRSSARWARCNSCSRSFSAIERYSLTVSTAARLRTSSV